MGKFKSMVIIDDYGRAVTEGDPGRLILLQSLLFHLFIKM